MVEAPDPEIDVDEIMQKIREEVARRKKLPEQETSRDPEQLVSKSSILEDNSTKKSFDHSRLAHEFISSDPVTQQSLPGHLEISILPYYINYHGFLVQAKENEGLKGRIKHFLFKFIRFFALWQ